VQIARELADKSDVVIENFKVGGADKLGLGYEQLSASNPGLVYCSISGYARMTVGSTSGPATTCWCRARPASWP
jgi:crotonobetainyl-CoA:carnitine CoA-transferase CaiB-like acyl-CoA transferase